jgi:hypothetical protein
MLFSHLSQLEQIFNRMQAAGFKVNLKKSLFGETELEYLGYWVATTTGIQTGCRCSEGERAKGFCVFDKFCMKKGNLANILQLCLGCLMEGFVLGRGVVRNPH